MKICLINPPDIVRRNEDCDYDHNFYTIPHIGIGYIGAVLETNGFKTDILECSGERIDLRELLKLLDERRYDMIGISTYYYNINNVVRIVKGVKTKRPDVFLFLGGYLPTLSYNMVLKSIKEADCCVLGEGEYTLLGLASAVRDKRDWRAVPGIAYIKDGTIEKSPDRPLISNLDELPFPRRVFICKNKMVALITSRGCYGSCTFCGTKEFYEGLPGKISRSRSPENVVEELEYLTKNNHIRYVTFNDDNFLSGSMKQKEWLKKFCSIMRERKFNIQFRVAARANEIEAHRDMLPELMEVGLNSAFIGIESMVQRQLDFYNKRVKVQSNVNALKILKDLQIKINIGFLMLDPFTTLDEILTNIRALKNTEFYKSVVEGHLPITTKNPVMPIAGTAFHTFMKNKGLLRHNEIMYDFQDEGVSFYYKVICNWGKKILPVHYKYYLIYKASEYKEYDIKTALKKEKEKLMLLDLDLAEKLSTGIMNGSITNNNYADFLSVWDESLSVIRHNFLEAEKALQRYA